MSQGFFIQQELGKNSAKELIVPDLGFFAFRQVECHPDPWAQEIAKLLLPVPDIQDREAFSIWFFNLCVLDHLIKVKWDSHRKPIIARKGKLFGPIAEFWKTVIDLCLEMHPSVKNEFPSAVEWFGALYSEMELAGISTGRGTRFDLKQFKSENAWLQKLSHKEHPNPFQQKETARFVEMASTSAEASNVFRKERYNPFHEARAKLAKLYSKPEFSSFKEKNGELYVCRSKLGSKYRKL